MLNSSNWTGRTPRTLEHAFGAHTSRHIQQPYTPMSRSDKIVVTAGLIAMAVIAVLALAGVI